MKKSTLTDFISKYSLGGEVESVLLQVKDKKLECKFRSVAKTVMGNLTFNNIDMEDGDLGIYNTSNLLKILGALDDEINITYDESAGKLMKIKFSDKAIKAEFVLADPSILPEVEPLKSNPPEDITFAITSDMIVSFNKAKSALGSEEKTFAIMADNDGIVKLILNYSRDLNTNRIELTTPAKKDSVFEPVFFNSDIFKEIMNANKNCSRGAMKVAQKGLATIVFQGEEFSSIYYMQKIAQ